MTSRTAPRGRRPQRREVGWPLPLTVSSAFVVLGCAYVFAWPSVVWHHHFVWFTPPDLGATYRAAISFAHGHFGAVYEQSRTSAFITFPGILLALAPFGALSGAFHTTVILVSHNGHALAHPERLVTPHTTLLSPDIGTAGGNVYIGQPQWLVFGFPFTLVLSCSALFSFDVLARRFQVPEGRRWLLAVTEAVLLWNVAVLWGHPEDAVAVALAVFSLIFALDRRFTGSGWLFGAAIAFQPLVVLMLPILLVIAGWQRALRLVGLAAIPPVVLLAPELIAGFSTTFHALSQQPTFPNVDRITPWTTFAHHLAGTGQWAKVSGGPARIVALVLAAGLAWWATRLRSRPEMVVWACAAALALRSVTELVMTDYYMWPVLAFGVVLVAIGSALRFYACLVVAIAVTVVAQLHMPWLAWWLLVIGGLAVVLAVAAWSVLSPVPALSTQPDTMPANPSRRSRTNRPPTPAARSASSARARQSTRGAVPANRPGRAAAARKGASAR